MAAVNYTVAIKPPNKIYTTFESSCRDRARHLRWRAEVPSDLLWTPRNGTSVVNVVSREEGGGQVLRLFFSLRLGNSFVEIGQSLNFYQLLSSIENNNNNFDYSSIELKLVRISI